MPEHNRSTYTPLTIEAIAPLPIQAITPLPIQAITPLPIEVVAPAPVEIVAGPSIATNTQKTVTNVSSVIVPNNPSRRRLILYNDSGAVVFVMLGPVCSVSAFSYRLGANDLHDGPLGGYTGVVSAVRASGTSVMQVTELTT